jgi:HAD superfamily hydrolase (TIGR01549 family)
VIDTAVVDLDGTLVDSNYQQVLAWSRAFAELNVQVELWRLHQHMGMGGDRLVAAVAGKAIEVRSGDELRDCWRRNYDELIGEVQPLDGAAELMDGLAGQGLKVVIASSGRPEHTQMAMRLVGIDGRFPSTDSQDADATKPAPDLVKTAVEKVEGTGAVMIGDTVWDIEAAERSGFPTIAVLTGGIARSTLQEAGATVFTSPRDLLEHLDQALEAAAHANT